MTALAIEDANGVRLATTIAPGDILTIGTIRYASTVEAMRAELIHRASAQPAVVEAAVAWAKARREMLALPVKSPEWLPRLNVLSEAEDALRQAVDALGVQR